MKPLPLDHSYIPLCFLTMENQLFSVQSVTEAQKSRTLNKYLFVFTVFTIFFLPPTFVVVSCAHLSKLTQIHRRELTPCKAFFSNSLFNTASDDGNSTEKSFQGKYSEHFLACVWTIICDHICNRGTHHSFWNAQPD